MNDKIKSSAASNSDLHVYMREVGRGFWGWCEGLAGTGALLFENVRPRHT